MGWMEELERVDAAVAVDEEVERKGGRSSV